MPIPLACPLLGAGISCLEEYCAWWVEDENEEREGHCVVKGVLSEYRDKG